jgi:hypothetical protein
VKCGVIVQGRVGGLLGEALMEEDRFSRLDNRGHGRHFDGGPVGMMSVM